MRTKRESGVRKYLRRSVRQRLYQWWITRRIGHIGEGVFIEEGSELMRHREQMRIGDHVIIKAGARICPTHGNAHISIGRWTTIGYHTYIFSTQCIAIGQHCLISPFCYLVDANHSFRRESLIRLQPMSAEPITIEDDVWLGSGVTVLRGVTIGQGSVIGAGSVVSNDVPSYAIASGNPASVVGERK